MLYSNVARTVINVELNKDYSVTAMVGWNNDNKCQTYSFYLERKDIPLLDKMEKFQNIDILDAGNTEIRIYLANLIYKLYHNGNFNYYIKRFEDMMHTFDVGIEHLESN